MSPLLRIRLLRIAAEDHLLLLTFHHFAFDAWSQAVLLRELAAFYGAPLRETHLQAATFQFNTPTSQRGIAVKTVWMHLQPVAASGSVNLVIRRLCNCRQTTPGRQRHQKRRGTLSLSCRRNL